MGRFLMLQSLRRLMFDRDRAILKQIHSTQARFERLNDAELRAAASRTQDLADWIALSAIAALRVLGQEMYDVQLQGAITLARGFIAEMQTGEGKTLAAVAAISWLAREHRGVHG
jgi:preprotein translocase subunit SecA